MCCKKSFGGLKSFFWTKPFFFQLRPVVHGKKTGKQTGKNKTVFLFCPKKVDFCLVHGKQNKKGFVFCLFCVFFLIQNHFHVKWNKKKSFCFDLKISFFVYDWSIDAGQNHTNSHLYTNPLSNNQTQKPSQKALDSNLLWVPCTMEFFLFFGVEKKKTIFWTENKKNIFSVYYGPEGKSVFSKKVFFFSFGMKIIFHVKCSKKKSVFVKKEFLFSV